MNRLFGAKKKEEVKAPVPNANAPSLTETSTKVSLHWYSLIIFILARGKRQRC